MCNIQQCLLCITYSDIQYILMCFIFLSIPFNILLQMLFTVREQTRITQNTIIQNSTRLTRFQQQIANPFYGSSTTIIHHHRKYGSTKSDLLPDMEKRLFLENKIKFSTKFWFQTKAFPCPVNSHGFVDFFGTKYRQTQLLVLLL